MTTPPDHESSAGQVKLLVWLAGALAVVAGAVTLAVVSLSLNEVKQHHHRSERARQEVARALQDLREYRVSMTRALRRIGIASNFHSDGSTATPIHPPEPFDSFRVGRSLEEAKYGIQALSGAGDEVTSLAHLEANLQAVHRALKEFYHTKSSANALSDQVTQQAVLVREALGRMRVTVSKEIGRHRLNTARMFAALNRDDGSRVSMLEELADEWRKGQSPRQIQDDLSDLALMTEQVVNAQEVDALRSLKDNRIRQSLSRIKRNSVRLQAGGAKFGEQVDAFVESLFGTGSRDDTRHQTMVAGVGGLYQLSIDLIEQRRALQRITEEAEGMTVACREAEKSTNQTVEMLCIRAQRRMGRQLQASSYTLFAVAGVASAIFLLGNVWIVRLIARAMRQTEEKQRESMEMARIIRESPSEVYIISRDTLRFVEANKGACVSTGYELEQLREMSPVDLQPEFSMEEFCSNVAPLASGREHKLEYHAEQRRSDGNLYPVQVSLHTACFGDEEVYVAFVNDLTKVRALEKQLSESQKLESIGQLAAGIAHEINTPMQFVGDNIEFLSECSGRLFSVLERYQTLLSSEQPMNWDERRTEIMNIGKECRFDHIREQVPAAIEESREGVQRTVKIVRAMKEFSHPGAKQRTVENLNDAIESTIAISRNRWKFVAELDLDLDADLPEVPVLLSEINQVLLNLVVNASDAIVDARADQPDALGRIGVRTGFDDDHVWVEVSDDGCGIPEEIKHKVFDPFFTTKEVGKGTGQGLAITHNVVVIQHNGQISVESQPGEGTTFRVKLPRSGSDDEAEASSGPQNAGTVAAPAQG